MSRYEPRDRYYRKARERGLPSRAAFKIEELIRGGKLARPGARVADLGCAPGGWLAILASAVGPSGCVVGVDLAEVRKPPSGVRVIAGDIADPLVARRVADALGSLADLVTSDLAPKLSGISSRDEARQHELLDAALAFARGALRRDGTMIAKLFMGAAFKDAVAKFEREFKSVEVTRTAATRPGSSELYIVARGYGSGRGS